MTRLPALTSALATVTGIEAAAANNIARQLREGGLISLTGRGEAAAHMQVSDAAALLVALGSPFAPAVAPAAVLQFRSLLPQYAPNDADGWRGELSRCGTFGEAVELLIMRAGVIFDDFSSRVARAFDTKDDHAITQLVGIGAALRLRVRLSSHMAAAVEIEAVAADGSWILLDRWRYFPDMDRLFGGFYTLRRSGDLEVETRISLNTIFAAFFTLEGKRE